VTKLSAALEARTSEVKELQEEQQLCRAREEATANQLRQLV
jgi:hypothetical protein